MASKNFVNRITEGERNPFTDVSLWTLVATNAATIYFALADNWSFSAILLTYWFQSIIIGFFVVLRILLAKNYLIKGFLINGKPQPSSRATKIKVAIFFAFVYGIFHAMFLVFLQPLSIDSPSYVFVASIFPIIKIPVLYFFLNHTFSFFYNWRNDAIKKRNIGEIIGVGTLRVYPIALIAIFSGLVFTFAEVSSMVAALLLLIVKSYGDAKLHIIEHSMRKHKDLP